MYRRSLEGVILAIVAAGLPGCIGMSGACNALLSGNQAPLAELKCRSDAGDRVAMTRLARRLETGDGIARDESRAARLYRTAATAVPSRTVVYAPPARIGGSGGTSVWENVHAGPGIAEAKYRLGRMYLEGRGVRANARYGHNLLAEAARQGFAEPAVTLGAPH